MIAGQNGEMSAQDNIQSQDPENPGPEKKTLQEWGFLKVPMLKDYLRDRKWRYNIVIIQE